MGLLKLYKKQRFKHRKGVTAIEYALILPIFAIFVFSIIELGLVMFVRSVVNHAVLEAGRFSITGDNYAELQVVPPGEEPVDAETFIINRVTERLEILPFGEQVPVVRPIILGELEILDETGRPASGRSKQIIMYEVQYTWDVISPLIGLTLGDDGEILISARTVVKNEGY